MKSDSVHNNAHIAVFERVQGLCCRRRWWVCSSFVIYNLLTLNIFYPGIALSKCISLRDPHCVDRVLLADKPRNTEEQQVQQYGVEKPINEIVVAHLKVIRTLSRERKTNLDHFVRMSGLPFNPLFPSSSWLPGGIPPPDDLCPGSGQNAAKVQGRQLVPASHVHGLSGPANVGTAVREEDNAKTRRDLRKGRRISFGLLPRVHGWLPQHGGEYKAAGDAESG